MLGEGLYALLAIATPVTNLLGTSQQRGQKTNGDDRSTGIFPVMMPEKTLLPAIVMTQIFGAGNNSMDGANLLHSARMQISYYGKNYSDAKQLAKAVRFVLEGFGGALPDGTVVDYCGMLLETDGFEEAPFIHHVPVDFEILYQESSGGLSLTTMGLKVETFAGDGSTVTFTIAVTPLAAAAVYKNGLLQNSPGDYSMSGRAVTFVTAPGSRDMVAVVYV